MNFHLITLMILLPFFGTLLQAFLPTTEDGRHISAARWVSLGSSLGAGLCGIVLVLLMDPVSAEIQSREALAWIGSYSITYDVGIDGLNALLVLLISIIFPILITSEWNQKKAVRGVHGLLLILQSSLLGAVCSQDIFLLFFFWALSAIPFYFLIGIWGGEGRESAALRSGVSSVMGNALFFAAIVIIYYSIDPHTFSLAELAGGRLEGKTFPLLGKDLSVSHVCFFLIGAGLALRAPVWPFNGWFTTVADEATPSVFVALSGVVVPVATYVFMRICYALFPETTAESASTLMILGAVNLLVGAICAFAQKGLKLMLAFVCLGEVGLILMGIGSMSSPGIVGAVYQQFALGLALAGFGLFSGVLLERTGQTRFTNDDGKPVLGGIIAVAPWAAFVFAVVVASLLGFPGVGGFVGHALVLIGAYDFHPMTVVLAAIALLLSTFYMFTMYRFVFFGKPGGSVSGFADLTLRERAYLFPLVGALLLFGLYPKPLIELVRPAALTLLSVVK